MLRFKAGNGEVVFYLIPGTLGAEYYPERYLDYFVKYETWDYGEMPFMSILHGAEMNEASFPMRIIGHFYLSFFNGDWPHKSVAVGIPFWLPPLLYLIVCFAKKLNAEHGEGGKASPATS